jgi:uncharacterized coiled-coil protein SlyX
MQVAEQVGTLEEVTAKLAERRATVAGLQREVEAATQEAAGLKNLREKFLVAASTGDTATSRHVEEIESKQLVIGRKVEGLRLRLQIVEAEVQAVEAEWRELATAAATAERARRADELRCEAQRLMHNQIAHWRAGCRVAHELRIFLASVEDDLGLTTQQKIEIQQAAGLLFDAQNAYNERWTTSGRSAGGWRHIISPQCPPDALRHLEELK